MGHDYLGDWERCFVCQMKFDPRDLIKVQGETSILLECLYCYANNDWEIYEPIQKRLHWETRQPFIIHKTGNLDWYIDVEDKDRTSYGLLKE